MPSLVEKLRSWLEFLQGLAWALALVSAGFAFVLLIVWQSFVLPLLSRRTIYARAFVVEDSNGKERVALGLAGNNSVALQLFDSNGKNKAELGLPTNGETVLRLSDENGPRVSLGVADNGAALELFDVGSKADAVKLAVDRSGSVILGLGHRSGDQFEVTVSETSGTSGLTVSDADGKLIIGIELVKEPGMGLGQTEYRPELEVWDSSRKHAIWRAIKSLPAGNQ